LAHNDFYDDQILVTPDGHLVLVDFEEIGPGDPLFDVGNMLAHLSWMARFGIATEACNSYHHRVRSAALERFRWEAQDLDLREAFAIFRLSTNPFRRLQRSWPTAIKTGLSLVVEVLARGR
jgi:thiamine kinase-like enzyme